jgi:hypothetical protein
MSPPLLSQGFSLRHCRGRPGRGGRPSSRRYIFNVSFCQLWGRFTSPPVIALRGTQEYDRGDCKGTGSLSPGDDARERDRRPWRWSRRGPPKGEIDRFNLPWLQADCPRLGAIGLGACGDLMLAGPQVPDRKPPLAICVRAPRAPHGHASARYRLPPLVDDAPGHARERLRNRAGGRPSRGWGLHCRHPVKREVQSSDLARSQGHGSPLRTIAGGHGRDVVPARPGARNGEPPLAIGQNAPRPTHGHPRSGQRLALLVQDAPSDSSDLARQKSPLEGEADALGPARSQGHGPALSAIAGGQCHDLMRTGTEVAELYVAPAIRWAGECETHPGDPDPGIGDRLAPLIDDAAAQACKLGRRNGPPQSEGHLFDLARTQGYRPTLRAIARSGGGDLVRAGLEVSDAKSPLPVRGGTPRTAIHAFCTG